MARRINDALGMECPIVQSPIAWVATPPPVAVAAMPAVRDCSPLDGTTRLATEPPGKSAPKSSGRAGKKFDHAAANCIE